MKELAARFFSWLHSLSIAKIADSLSNNVQPVDNLTGSFEAIILAFSGPLATWLIAIPNIWLVVQWSEGLFGFDWTLSWPIAVGFEMVGQSLSNHWSSCRQWNAVVESKNKKMSSLFAFVLMSFYFTIDLVMVGILAAQRSGSGESASVFLTLIFPIVVIIVALATNERSTLYRLRRERERLQAVNVQLPENKTELTQLRAEFTKLQQQLTSRPKPRPRKVDFETWIANLNGRGAKLASEDDVLALLAADGWNGDRRDVARWWSGEK